MAAQKAWQENMPDCVVSTVRKKKAINVGAQKCFHFYIV